MYFLYIIIGLTIPITNNAMWQQNIPKTPITLPYGPPLMENRWYKNLEKIYPQAKPKAHQGNSNPAIRVQTVTELIFSK